MYPSEAIKIYSEPDRAQQWLRHFSRAPWSLVCTVGFTETALIPGISAAGKTPSDRRWTAHADAEFLVSGPQGRSTYPLPPLEAGLSPVLISRALAEAQAIPIIVLNAGLPDTGETYGDTSIDLSGLSGAQSVHPDESKSEQPSSELHENLLSPKLSSAQSVLSSIPDSSINCSSLPEPQSSVPNPHPSLGSLIPLVDLGGVSARCVSTGQTLDLAVVQSLFQAGLHWGEKLASTVSPRGYLVLGECVVGGTTTALGVLSGLGVAASGRVNSSHPQCNHPQKQALVQQGLERAGFCPESQAGLMESNPQHRDPFQVVAAVGDPMQIVVAALAIAASQRVGVLLAGGTQMLAVYALATALQQQSQIDWNPDLIVVGTTRWVTDDPTGDTAGLAQAIGDRFPQAPSPMLLATALNFSQSSHPALRLYEAGFVKEGVAAGGSAIATSLSQGWDIQQLRTTIDQFCDRYYAWRALIND